MNEPLSRSLLARPLAFALGAAAGYALVPGMRLGGLLFWFAGPIVVVGLALWSIHRVDRFASPAMLASPVVSLFGWATLVVFTGGLRSPLLAAFFLEIALASVTLGTRAVLWVSGWVAFFLLGVAHLYLYSQGITLLMVELGFVAAVGSVGFAVARRRQAAELALLDQRERLGGRLAQLQRQLEDERIVSRVGENVARLAHGLKNAVHSLRGFVALIEPQIDGQSGAKAALQGLRLAIDELESLARMTLEEGRAPEVSGEKGATVDATDERTARLARVVEQARQDLAIANAESEWTVRVDDDARALRVRLAEALLLELLVVLMRNAVEAMEGKGRGTIEIGRAGDRAVLRIEDEGPGFETDDWERIFQPGFTTKPEGSGFGLFLARRIVTENGGTLQLARGARGGALVRVELPLAGGEVSGNLEPGA